VRVPTVVTPLLMAPLCLLIQGWSTSVHIAHYHTVPLTHSVHWILLKEPRLKQVAMQSWRCWGLDRAQIVAQWVPEGRQKLDGRTCPAESMARRV